MSFPGVETRNLLLLTLCSTLSPTSEPQNKCANSYSRDHRIQEAKKTQNSSVEPEAEFKEFEPFLKIKTRLKHGWFH